MVHQVLLSTRWFLAGSINGRMNYWDGGVKCSPEQKQKRLDQVTLSPRRSISPRNPLLHGPWMGKKMDDWNLLAQHPSRVQSQLTQMCELAIPFRNSIIVSWFFVMACLTSTFRGWNNRPVAKYLELQQARMGRASRGQIRDYSVGIPLPILMTCLMLMKTNHLWIVWIPQTAVVSICPILSPTCGWRIRWFVLDFFPPAAIHIAVV